MQRSLAKPYPRSLPIRKSEMKVKVYAISLSFTYLAVAVWAGWNAVEPRGGLVMLAIVCTTASIGFGTAAVCDE